MVDTPNKIKKMGAPAVYLFWIHNPHMRTRPTRPELPMLLTAKGRKGYVRALSSFSISVRFFLDINSALFTENFPEVIKSRLT